MAVNPARIVESEAIIPQSTATAVRRNQRARAARGRAARSLLVAGAVEDIIRRALCLGRSMNQKLAIVAKLLQPAGHVGRLIRDHCVGDSGFGAKVGCSHLCIGSGG
jgi:hypothetical protein